MNSYEFEYEFLKHPKANLAKYVFHSNAYFPFPCQICPSFIKYIYILSCVINILA
jgi:hypothetical protein